MAIELDIRYLGMLAEKTGCEQEDMRLQASTTVRALRQSLETRYPELKGMVYKVAVSQHLATDDSEINADVEIALLPPFAGG